MATAIRKNPAGILVRPVQFEYPAQLAAQRHPDGAYGVHAVSLLMPDLEPLLIDAIRAAIPRLDDGLAEEAKGYVGQKAHQYRQHRCFKRRGLERLARLTPKPLVVRYERERPGELLHLDIKKRTCGELGLRHLRTRPYTPRTNGKASASSRRSCASTLVRETQLGSGLRRNREGRGLGLDAIGGGGGIRTPGTLSSTPDFESGSFNRTLTPLRGASTLAGRFRCCERRGLPAMHTQPIGCTFPRAR